MLKHTVKLFDTGSSVFVKVEFLISISLRLLGAFSKYPEKPFLLLFFLVFISYFCLPFFLSLFGEE